MIYTVTFNPAIDYIMRLEAFRQGETNRSLEEDILFGGKGINVSVILNRLGTESTALGFIGGFTGAALSDHLESIGINTDFVRLKSGCTRINVKLKSEAETEINGQGPHIPEEAIEELFHKLNALKNGDTVVLAGSIPKSLPDDIYEKILGELRGRDIRAVVDATGKLLLNTLSYKPFLIKPNHIELGELFGRTDLSEEEITECAFRLKEKGAANVLVSMAEKGAILIDETGAVHKAPAPKGTVVNSVGAGDSMLAGFISALEKGNSYDKALKLGIAAGSATAFSEDLAEKEKIEEIYKSL